MRSRCHSLHRRLRYRSFSGFTHVTARRIAQPPIGDLCHEAPALAVTRTSRSSVTGSAATIGISNAEHRAGGRDIGTQACSPRLRGLQCAQSTMGLSTHPTKSAPFTSPSQQQCNNRSHLNQQTLARSSRSPVLIALARLSMLVSSKKWPCAPVIPAAVLHGKSSRQLGVHFRDVRYMSAV
jgi:hypothetical protein